jgi:hypothetical protein
MTPPESAGAPEQATTVRIIHVALVLGVVAFTVGLYLGAGPALANVSIPRPAIVALVGASFAATAVAAFALRRRVPPRSTDQSANMYWSTVGPGALVMWAVFEAGALTGVIAWLLGGGVAALAAATLAFLALVALHPGRLERT